MSTFIAIALSKKAERIRDFFDNRIQLKEISSSPFGKSVISKKENYRAWLVLYKGESGELLDQTKQERHSDLLICALRRLVLESPTVALCWHWFRGLTLTEEVSIKEKRIVNFSDFEKAFPDIEEDILYVILNNTRSNH